MAIVNRTTSGGGVAMSTRPLEIIPFFRRYPRSWWRDIIYTLIWNTLIAVVLTGFIAAFGSRADLAYWLRIDCIFANCIPLGYALRKNPSVSFCPSTAKQTTSHRDAAQATGSLCFSGAPRSASTG